jgi:hypothetical protein
MLAAEQLLPGQAAWIAFPASIMVKITPTGPLSSNQGQHSSFLFHLSDPPPPLLIQAYTEHMTSKRVIVMEDAKYFLLSPYLGPAPLATTSYS